MADDTIDPKTNGSSITCGSSPLFKTKNITNNIFIQQGDLLYSMTRHDPS